MESTDKISYKTPKENRRSFTIPGLMHDSSLSMILKPFDPTVFFSIIILYNSEVLLSAVVFSKGFLGSRKAILRLVASGNCSVLEE